MMTGWLIFLGFAAAILLLLWRVARLDRGTMMLVGSALFVAAAGYTWQGSPGLAGAPMVEQVQRGLKRDTLFAIEHQRLLGRFGHTADYLGSADAMNRIGEDRAAVSVMQTAVTKFPREAALRIGLAHALFIQADANITPAVKLALDQARALTPDDPAPAYFQGLMAFEAGDPLGAERQWRALYASLPEKSEWRPELARRLQFFDLVREAAARGRPAVPAQPRP